MLALLVGVCALPSYTNTGNSNSQKSGMDIMAATVNPVIVNAAEPDLTARSVSIESEEMESQIRYKAEQIKYATSHKKVREKYAISYKEETFKEPLPLSDIYAEPETIAMFKCFYPDAVSYVWEIYDQQTDEWKAADNADVIEITDELDRKVSTFLVPAEKNNGNQTVRCRTERKTEDDISETATLHILPYIKDISAEEYTSDAGQYISAGDIPLLVSYQDGSKETITGLNSLYFLHKEETTEQGTTDSGSMTETINNNSTHYL